MTSLKVFTFESLESKRVCSFIQLLSRVRCEVRYTNILEVPNLKPSFKRCTKVWTMLFSKKNNKKSINNSLGVEAAYVPNYLQKFVGTLWLATREEFRAIRGSHNTATKHRLPAAARAETDEVTPAPLYPHSQLNREEVTPTSDLFLFFLHVANKFI